MREFIHGNRDGPNRSNRTYTVCRIEVPGSQLVEETKKQLHPGYHVAEKNDKEFVMSNPTSRVSTNPDLPQGRTFSTNLLTRIGKMPFAEDTWLCAAQDRKAEATGAKDYLGLPRKPGDDPQVLELIHRDHVGDRYTVCRLGVPRRQLVREIATGLHPGYHVANIHGRRIPKSNPGGHRLDSPWSCGLVQRT